MKRTPAFWLRDEHLLSGLIKALGQQPSAPHTYWARAFLPRVLQRYVEQKALLATKSLAPSGVKKQVFLLICEILYAIIAAHLDLTLARRGQTGWNESALLEDATLHILVEWAVAVLETDLPGKTSLILVLLLTHIATHLALHPLTKQQPLEDEVRPPPLRSLVPAIVQPNAP